MRPSLVTLPAIERPAVSLVATPAKSHVEGFNLVCNRHLLNFTMTKRTYLVDTLYRHAFIIEDETLQMFLMGEVNKIGDVMYLLPGRRLTFFPVFGQLLDTFLIGGNDAVATHAFAGWRDTGHLAATGIGMTVHAIDLVYIRMDVMRKFDGLFHILSVIRTDRWYCVRYFGVRDSREQDKPRQHSNNQKSYQRDSMRT